ncbi:MAG: hypothetical protein UMU75_02965 [Halomonas sp.]|nr:hypothetical protein [Halomonas sp.]
MPKLLVSVLMTLLAIPALAAPAATLSLPANARVDVQVIDSVVLDSRSPARTDVLLRPVHAAQSDATHRLPDYCLITADARIEGDRVRLTTQSATCIETASPQPEIFSGEFAAAAYERAGDYGLDVCTTRQDGTCQRATIEPTHTFQLAIGRDVNIQAQANPSARINEQRREADNRDGATQSAP